MNWNINVNSEIYGMVSSTRKIPTKGNTYLDVISTSNTNCEGKYSKINDAIIGISNTSKFTKNLITDKWEISDENFNEVFEQI